MIEGIDYGIDVSGDGGTVWVHSADGSCIGRFSKKFGIDVHTSVSAQMAGEGQCLHCTHEPAGQAAWSDFRAQIKTHYRIDIPDDLVSWK